MRRTPGRQHLAMQLDNPPWCPASRGLRKFHKRQRAKAVRRDGKQNWEYALKQNKYRGWVS